MKKIFLLAPLAILAACHSNPPAPTADSAKIVNDSAAMVKDIQSPYQIMYSSKFVMDDPKNAESLLAIWKAYDNGNLSSVKDLFADTMVAYLAGGGVMSASRDSTIAAVQSARNMLKSAVDRVDAIMAVKSTDKNEHWALIWGTETDTHKNGKVDSVALQETWRFNQDGKADFLLQAKRELTPPKKMK